MGDGAVALSSPFAAAIVEGFTRSTGALKSSEYTRPYCEGRTRFSNAFARFEDLR